MPVVSFTDLHNNAVSNQYKLPVINIYTISSMHGIVNHAVRCDSPVVFTVHGQQLDSGFLPSIKMLIDQAKIPAALLAKNIDTTGQGIQAIRSGCNGLIISDKVDESTKMKIYGTASSCGIPAIQHNELYGTIQEIDEDLDLSNLNLDFGNSLSWHEFDESISRAVVDRLKGQLENAGSNGQGQSALKECKPWHPVEHLIIYNSNTDDETSVRIAAEGRRVLSKIPGVTATWSGKAVNPDAKYQWCWLIRFAHPAVIDSYRDNPAHVAYADNHFRPIAGDRISIDFELTGVDE